MTTNETFFTEYQRLRNAQLRFEPDKPPAAFAVATVIAVRGSASARPGSKALITADGKNVFGWVGGGCAESFVCQNAVEAMAENAPRIVTADLDDEIFGLGMPCGGVMDIFIEPVLPKPLLVLRGHEVVAQNMAWLADALGFRVIVDDPQAKPEHFRKAELKKANSQTQTSYTWDETLSNETLGDQSGVPAFAQALLQLASRIAAARGLKFQPMVHTRGIYPVSNTQFDLALNPANFKSAPQVLIVGHSRITEELARLIAVLGWPLSVIGHRADEGTYPRSAVVDGEFDLDQIAPVVGQSKDSAAANKSFQVDQNTVVIIAAHHKGDHLAIKKSIAAQARYIGLVASTKRARLIFESLQESGVDAKELALVRAPAGLEMGTQTPLEIAVSIVSEILSQK